jgi:mRNA interferase MazF
MRKIRPAVVVSIDSVGRLPLRIVVPLTDWQDPFASLPWFVQVPASPTNGLTKDSGADSFQVKSVSENRFVRRLGLVTSSQLDDIASTIAMCVGAP